MATMGTMVEVRQHADRSRSRTSVPREFQLTDDTGELLIVLHVCARFTFLIELCVF